MDRRSQHRTALRFFVAIIFASIHFSCSTTESIPRYSKSSPESATASVSHASLFEGWDDITHQSMNPSIELWLINKRHSSSILLRHFIIDDTTTNALDQEDICTIGHLSLRLKLAERFHERRITRVPEMMTDTINFCAYIYEENGILRRVVVFKNEGAYFELELMQEETDSDFKVLAKEQNEVLRMIMNRK